MRKGLCLRALILLSLLVYSKKNVFLLRDCAVVSVFMKQVLLYCDTQISTYRPKRRGILVSPPHAHTHTRTHTHTNTTQHNTTTHSGRRGCEAAQQWGRFSCAAECSGRDSGRGHQVPDGGGYKSQALSVIYDGFVCTTCAPSPHFPFLFSPFFSACHVSLFGKGEWEVKAKHLRYLPASCVCCPAPST